MLHILSDDIVQVQGVLSGSKIYPSRTGVIQYIAFDMFGESIISLSAECCFAPLDVCG